MFKEVDVPKNRGHPETGLTTAPVWKRAVNRPGARSKTRISGSPPKFSKFRNFFLVFQVFKLSSPRVGLPGTRPRLSSISEFPCYSSFGKNPLLYELCYKKSRSPWDGSDYRTSMATSGKPSTWFPLGQLAEQASSLPLLFSSFLF